jgi:hypothetical protein
MNKVKDLTFWADNELQDESKNQSTSDHLKKDVITKNLEIEHGNSINSRMNSNLSIIDENKIYQSPPVLIKQSEIDLSANPNSFQTVKLSEVYLKYLKITGFCWLFCAITMIIMSYIGYTLPNQKTGYTCLSCPEKYYVTLEPYTCNAKKLNLISCSSTTECREDLGLRCKGGKCQCNSLDYGWSIIYQSCKFIEQTSCSANNDCLEPMNCTSSTCQCSPFKYHDLSSLVCLNQNSYNGTCTVKNNCRVDKNLECQNGLCKCISTYPIWSYGYDSCMIPKIYNQYCFSTNDCNMALNLRCKDATQSCICPSNIANNYCDCPARTLNNEYYWNNVICTLAGNYGESCSSDYQCQNLKNLYCISNTCNCTTGYLWKPADGMCVSINCSIGWYFNLIDGYCYSFQDICDNGSSIATNLNSSAYTNFVNNMQVFLAITTSINFAFTDTTGTTDCNGFDGSGGTFFFSKDPCSHLSTTSPKHVYICRYLL